MKILSVSQPPVFEMIRRVINILFVVEYQCYRRLLFSLHAHLKGLLGEKKPYS